MFISYLQHKIDFAYIVFSASFCLFKWTIKNIADNFLTDPSTKIIFSL